MNETSNQNENYSNTLEQNLNAVANETEITTQSIQDCQTNTLTTESVSYTEFNTENLIPFIDESEDEPLLHIPPLANNRRICSNYWLEILISSIILSFFVMIIIVGVLFSKDSKTSSVSPKGCNKQSETGKSCSINNLKTTVLVSLKYSSYNERRTNFSFIYTALSNTTIITFSFGKGWNFYLDNVSIRDTSNDVELIEDGGFETGTLYAYCVCDSSFRRTKPTEWKRHSGSFVCDVNNFFSAVQLSQSVNTNAGHEYDVSFWLESQSSFDNALTVYMSSAFQINKHFIGLLLTRFIIIFFVFYTI